jgi:hypothetical protein
MVRSGIPERVAMKLGHAPIVRKNERDSYSLGTVATDRGWDAARELWKKKSGVTSC